MSENCRVVWQVFICLQYQLELTYIFADFITTVNKKEEIQNIFCAYVTYLPFLQGLATTKNTLF